MFMPDGSASCAYVYPVSVNGRKGGYYDPYANDQDWGLYFMLRYKNKIYTSGIGPQYIALPIDFAKIVKIRQISIKNFFKSIDIKKSIVHN